MLYYTADARDGGARGGCNTCCCDSMVARPGEINKVSINYAKWAAPIGGHGISHGTIFDISECKTCDDSNNPVSIENAFRRVNFDSDAVITIDLSTISTNATVYEVITRFGPFFGSFTLTGSSLVYIPFTTGVDRLWVKASDANGNSAISEIIFAIDLASTRQISQPEFRNDIVIDGSRVNVDRSNFLLSFALDISPAAKDGDIYRIIVRQPAIDCDYNKFFHEMCFDLLIKSC